MFRFLRQDAFDCILNQLARTAERKFFFQTSLVRFNGFYAQMQLLGDLTGRLAFAHAPEDFQLPVGKAV